MGTSGATALTIAREMPALHLRGWLLRRADVAEGEAAVLLHRDAIVRTYERPGHHPVLVLDDLVPGFVMDRRRLLLVSLHPVTLAMGWSGQAAGDGGLVSCRAELGVRVADPGRFARQVGRPLDGASLADELRRVSQPSLEAAVRSYAQGDLCDRQDVPRLVVAVVAPAWRRFLEERGLSLAGDASVRFAPQTRLQAKLQQLDELLLAQSLLGSDDFREALEPSLAGGGPAAGAVVDAWRKLLQEQPEGEQTLTPVKRDSPIPPALMMATLAPTVLGVGGGAVAQLLQTTKQFLAQAPAVGPAAGPLGGLLVSLPLTLAVKWAAARLWSRRSLASESSAVVRARAAERQAWTRVSLERARHDLETALAAVSACAASHPSDQGFQRSCGEVRTQVTGALELLGAGVVGGRSPSAKESIFLARLAVQAQALASLAGELASFESEVTEVLGAVQSIARDALGGLQEWQTYRLAR